MSSDSRWWDESWNATTGCAKVSAGCTNCWAERFAKRQAGRNGYPRDNPFAVTLHPDRLDRPLHWRRPRRIAVCLMGDLYHEDVVPLWRAMVFSRIERTPQHTYMILTKRPKQLADDLLNNSMFVWVGPGGDFLPRILPNLWLGVSVEDQETADDRLWCLRECLAELLFVSCEPLLGPIDLQLKSLTPTHDYEFGNQARARIGWVIVGGETGPHARPMHPDWARSIRDQCQEASVPFFFKQWGEWCDSAQLPALRPAQRLGIPYVSRLDLQTKQYQVGGYGEHLYRVGKKAAGRLLDGREWNEMPGKKATSNDRERATWQKCGW